jgi:hypothetical protein
MVGRFRLKGIGKALQHGVGADAADEAIHAAFHRLEDLRIDEAGIEPRQGDPGPAIQYPGELVRLTPGRVGVTFVEP